MPWSTHTTEYSAPTAENASCLLRRCIPLGVDSCSHLAVKVPRCDRWQPARGFATGQAASRAPSDLLRRVLGTLRANTGHRDQNQAVPRVHLGLLKWRRSRHDAVSGTHRRTL